MRLPPLTQSLLLVASTLIPTASSNHCKSTCPPALRLFIATLIPAAYNQPTVAASTAAFELVPFAPDAKVELQLPSKPLLTVATNATAARAFAANTRQVFTHVGATYEDFPRNKSTTIKADVTLAHTGKLPPSFQADVELEFDLWTCEISVLRAVGDIPAALLG